MDQEILILNLIFLGLLTHDVARTLLLFLSKIDGIKTLLIDIVDHSSCAVSALNTQLSSKLRVSGASKEETSALVFSLLVV